MFKSLVWLDLEISRRQRDSNLGSSALDAYALTIRPTRRFGWECKPGSCLCAHTSHRMNSKVSDILVQDGWTSAMKILPACTIYEGGMCLSVWLYFGNKERKKKKENLDVKTHSKWQTPEEEEEEVYTIMCKCYACDWKRIKAFWRKPHPIKRYQNRNSPKLTRTKAHQGGSLLWTTTTAKTE